MGSLKSKMLDTVRKYRMILPGEKIAVGVSGGPDSMALLYLLHDLRDDLKCTLHIAHLDHMLRGEESRTDAAYVAEHARKLDISVTLEAIDVRKMIMPKESLESGARRIRYKFYERVMAKVKADKVALGHNADDQSETVMMRLLRGSGAQGLSGIPPIRGNFIRPLIEISRSQIDEYLQEMQITPRQDSSNLNTTYTRNRIRHDLIPLLEKEYNQNIKRLLCQNGEILQAEDALLTDLARQALENCVRHSDARTVTIHVPALSEYHLALQRRILRLAIKTLAGNLRGFDYDHIQDLLNLALYRTTGSLISLPRGVWAEKVYDELMLRHQHLPRVPTESFDYSIKIPGETEIPDLGLSIRTIGPESVHGENRKTQPSKDEHRETFDHDKIRGDLHLRNRRPGDRFHPLGMSGTKKLKDFFMDEKIPRAMRNRVPILTDENNILWVIGYRIDDRFKITADTKSQLIVSAIPNRS